MTTIVIGSSGQLASHLRRLWPEGHFWGRETLDASDARQLERQLRETSPSAIVMAAAFTAVDRAEQEPEAAWALNADAPAAAARAAQAVGASLIHVSTDYVFDGSIETNYHADFATRPLSNYGRSKLAGELAVRSLCRKHWILRTSWLFSEFGTNFVKTILRMSRTAESLRIVADQFGTPTYAGDLANLIHAIEISSARPSVPFGTYHATGGPVVSWHGFAKRIVNEANEGGLLSRLPEVHAITTSEYPTPATRPLRAVLEPSTELKSPRLPRFDWEAGLRSTVAALSGPVRQ